MLRSWAVPRGLPTTARQNRLAIAVPDHGLDHVDYTDESKFIADTGWRPQRIHPVAGELRYTKYNPLLRLVMKFISKMAGGATDTSRDYVYTDWAGLNEMAAGLADEVR